MADNDYREQAHNLPVTVWVGKGGIETVTDELRDQLDREELVKVKFLRSARGNAGVDELAEKLGGRVDADLIDTRGHTAVYHK